MAPKKNFYAVKVGKTPGIYTSWDACQKMISGYSGAQFKGFADIASAQEYLGYAATPNQPNHSTNKSRSVHSTLGSAHVSKKTSSHTRNRKMDQLLYKEARGSIFDERQHIPANGNSAKFSETLNIYTDGSCFNNGRRNAKAGIGVYFGPNDPRNISEPLTSPPMTNNRAELMAVIRALQETLPAAPKTIHSDSKYVKQGITLWIQKWKKNGWKTSNLEPVKNDDLWKTLDSLVSVHNVTFKWVRGHAGNDGNEQADQLANEGASK